MSGCKYDYFNDDCINCANGKPFFHCLLDDMRKKNDVKDNRGLNDEELNVLDCMAYISDYCKQHKDCNKCVLREGSSCLTSHYPESYSIIVKEIKEGTNAKVTKG